MNEDYTQNNQASTAPSVSDVDAATATTLPAGSDVPAAPAPGGDHTADGIYPEAAYGYYGLVSGGDLDGGFPWETAAQAQYIAVQDISPDTALLLARIDYKLGAILSFLLISWCIKRIRAGVKGFTGRGLDE